MITCILFFGCSKEQTYFSRDGLYSVSVSDSQFTDYTQTAQTIVDQELPQTNAQLVTLLLSKEQNKQLIYGLSLPLSQSVDETTSIIHLTKIIEKELKNNPAILEYSIQTNPKKSQLQFTATNRLGKISTHESCLLTLTKSHIINICARLQNAKSNKDAAQLIKNIKVTIKKQPDHLQK
ncbi:hypothetical protein [Neisseria sp. Ec49-e6-T10]|uniref:hypothetical protein n=1 Tax=Neisseria sp. Ec49-e6-T10 TaxID=3140744 RepID=UPI003EBCAC82